MAGFLTIPKKYAIALLRQGSAYINNHPKSKQYLMAIARRIGLYPFVRAFYKNVSSSSSGSRTRNPYGFISTEIEHHSPRTRQIYYALKAAIEHQQKENG